MKKINIYTKYFADYGGAERVCFFFAKYLHENNIDFRIVCGKNKIKQKQDYEVIETGLARPGRYLKAVSFFKRAGEIALNHKGVNFSFDVIPNTDIFRTGGGSHKTFEKRSLMGLSGFEKFKKQTQRFFNPINITKPILEKKMISSPRFKKVISISRLTGREFQKDMNLPDELISVVHNGVNKQLFSIENRLKLSVNKPKDTVVIGFVSSNFKLKGLTELIDSLALLPKNFILKVAGGRNSSDFEKQAENLNIRERVYFCGKVSNMPEFYASLNILCHPTYYDTFANVVSESLNMGIPVAVSANAGAAEIVDDECGKVFEEVSPKNIAEAILHCAKLGYGDYSDRVLDNLDVFKKYLEIIKGIQ